MSGVEEKRTIVVTGFGPFSGHAVNASWEVVKTLAETGFGDDGLRLVIEEIPVEYHTVRKRVPELWQEHKPCLMVHVGVEGAIKVVQLEQQAHNGGYHQVDVRGATPDDHLCVSGADQCLQAGLDMQCVCDDINSCTKVKADVSREGDGGYLCDFIFFTSLHISRHQSAFIHVPPLNSPYTKEELAEAVKAAILSMVKQMVVKSEVLSQQ